jgi:hypothetical protein
MRDIRLLLIGLVIVIGGAAIADDKKPKAPAKPKVIDVEAGPLFDQSEASKTCPTVCKAPLVWNGSWRTTKPSVSSVCGCAEPAPPPPKGPTRDVEAGPLSGDADAKAKCPALCPAPATWSGAWRTTKPGAMSVCTCQDPATRSVAAGAIWSSADAKAQCTKACKAPMSWNGEWRTTKQGRSTSCDCLEPATK